MQSTTLLITLSTIGLATAVGYEYGSSYGKKYGYGNPAFLSGPGHYGENSQVHAHGYGNDKPANYGNQQHFGYGKPVEYGYGVGSYGPNNYGYGKNTHYEGPVQYGVHSVYGDHTYDKGYGYGEPAQYGNGYQNPTHYGPVGYGSPAHFPIQYGYNKMPNYGYNAHYEGAKHTPYYGSSTA